MFTAFIWLFMSVVVTKNIFLIIDQRFYKTSPHTYMLETSYDSHMVRISVIIWNKKKKIKTLSDKVFNFLLFFDFLEILRLKTISVLLHTNTRFKWTEIFFSYFCINLSLVLMWSVVFEKKFFLGVSESILRWLFEK